MAEVSRQSAERPGAAGVPVIYLKVREKLLAKARKCKGAYRLSIPEVRYILGCLFHLSGKEWFQVIKEMEKLGRVRLVPFNFVEVAEF